MHVINLWKSLMWLYKYTCICLVLSRGQEVSRCSFTAKAEEQPSGLGVRSRSPSHCRVQGSLPPASALSVRTLSTLPPKPLMQESTSFSRMWKKASVFWDKILEALVEPHTLSLELLGHLPQEQYSLDEAKLTTYICEAPVSLANCYTCGISFQPL